MTTIILSVLFSTLTFITFKLFKKFDIDNTNAITINYIVAFGFGLAISLRDYTLVEIAKSSWVWYACMLGFFFIAVYYLFALSSQKTGVALTSVASKMSVIIPVTIGLMAYQEKFNLMKLSGILMALIAFYLTLRKNGTNIKEVKFAFLPVLLFLGNGLVDTMIKFAQHHFLNDDLIPFLTVVFLTSFILGLFLMKTRKSKPKLHFKHVLGGITLGLLNFGSTFYILKALWYFDSSMVFPVANAGIVGLSSLAGFFAFREKLSLLNWTGIILAITAIIMIAYA